MRPLLRSMLTGVVVGLLAACGTANTPPPTPTSSSPSVADKTARPSLIFGDPPANPFRLDITTAPVHGRSAEMIAGLRRQIAARGGGVAINTGHFNSSFYVADSSTSRQRVGFDNCQHKPQTPPELYGGPAYFVGVPIPPSARAAKGTDGALAIWSPSENRFWEFWIASKSSSGAWTACWGGRIDDVDQGHVRFPEPFGASASGLATVGSMISIAEARSHEIDHAMNLALTEIATPSRIYFPANRSDGKDPAPGAIPMGSRLRLDPSVDVEALPLTPLGKAVARAAQKYGFIVTETSGAVSVGAESGQAERDRTGADPWPAILGGVPDYSQLDRFPWDRVQVLEAGYGAPSGVAASTDGG